MNNEIKFSDQSSIIIYQHENGEIRIEVRFCDETVYLTQAQLCTLYQTSKSTVSEHIKNIFDEEELDEQSTVRKFRTVQKEGNRTVTREIAYYNLDMIISLGYRIRSKVATQFRRWATAHLNEYMKKGFLLDDRRLKELGGGNYWKELLERIRDIRSSEKVMYRQVLDLYATSADYNPKSAESVAFFKMVQNKLHFAAHRHTAPEIIFEQTNASLPFMGLTSFSGAQPAKKDIGIAKNCLREDELKVLNNLVSGYFDFAELQAIRHRPMYMSDYIEHLDTILNAAGEKILEGAGSISHKKALDKAMQEYRKYQTITISSVEKDYMEAIKSIEEKAKDKNRQDRKNEQQK